MQFHHQSEQPKQQQQQQQQQLQQQQQVKLEFQTEKGQTVSRSVPASSLEKVEFYAGYADLLANPYQLQSGVRPSSVSSTTPPSFPFPPEAASGFDYYTSWLTTKAKMSQSALLVALKLAHQLGDDNYLSYLVGQVMLMDWNYYSPLIQELPQPLATDIYYRLPYSLIPDQLALQYSFFQEWLELNSRDGVIYRTTFKVAYQTDNNSNTNTTPIEIHICMASSKPLGNGNFFIFQMEEYVDEDFPADPLYSWTWYYDPELKYPIKSKTATYPNGERGDIEMIYTSWYQHGQVNREKVTTGSEEIETGYYPNGQKVFISVIDLATRYSQLTTYYDNENNTVKSVAGIDDNQMYHGSYEELSLSGELIAKGQYHHGGRVGLWDVIDPVVGYVIENYQDDKLLSRRFRSDALNA